MAEAAEVPDWHVGTDLQRQAQIQSAEISLLAILAAVQAVERKTEAQAVHLQSLEVRTATAEKRLADCEKTAVEFSNHMESKWAVLGTLLQEYGLLQRRLENLENLLRNRNSWALQLPPSSKGEAPKVPATAEVSECFSEQEEGSLEDGQELRQCVSTSREDGQELRQRVSTSREALVRQEADRWTSPGVVPWIKQEEEVCVTSLQRTATIRLCSAETWLASKEKRTPEGEPVGLEPAWAIEARPGKEDFQGGTCGDPLPVSGESVGVSLPTGPRSLPGPAAEGAERVQSSSSRDLGAQPQRPPHSPQPPPSAQRPPSAAPQGPFPRNRSAPPAQRSYTCVQCGKSFVHQSTLTTHYRTHTGEKPYACAECEKRFGRLSTLLEHRRTHTGERPFPCVQCGRRFGRLSTLVEHRRTHTGEKPFPCTQCDKRFTRLANLTVHQSVHSGERAFQCSQCGSCFAHKPAFLRHLRSHSQEKRFACGQCGKSFTCRSWLVRHQGTHATAAAPARGTCEKGSPSHETPARRLSCDPSVSPTSRDTRTPQDHAEYAGGRQFSGRGQEGLGGSLHSGLSVKMENAG